jgi:outer membrane usher protein
MTTPHVEQRFAVKRQSGYLLNFPVEKLRSASVILVDAQGQPLPVSSLVQRADHATEYVGWDGIVWMENLTARNPMEVVTPDGRRCETELRIASGQPQALKTYGPLTCALPAPAAGSAASPAESFTSGTQP